MIYCISEAQTILVILAQGFQLQIKLVLNFPEWLQLQPLLFFEVDNLWFILSGGYLVDSISI